MGHCHYCCSNYCIGVTIAPIPFAVLVPGVSTGASTGFSTSALLSVGRETSASKLCSLIPNGNQVCKGEGLGITWCLRSFPKIRCVNKINHIEKYYIHNPLHSRTSACFSILLRKKMRVGSCPAGCTASLWGVLRAPEKQLPVIPEAGR